MTPLWTATDVQKATNGKLYGQWHANRVVIDSRIVQKGDLFVALKGKNFDGNQFAEDALAKGASAVMIENTLNAESRKLNAIVVPDTLKALQDLGAYARKRTHANVIGLTGSVGKTSTKEMLKLALKRHGETFASYGNFNNHIGTPLNLANMPLTTQYAVLEMGMNHKGEIAELTRMVLPEIAMITNVEAVHLEFFKDVAEIAEAKSEIFEGLSEKGTALLNGDNAYVENCKRALPKHAFLLTLGKGRTNDIRLLECEVQSHGTHMKIAVPGKTLDFTIGAYGQHWAYACMFALATAYTLKLDLQTTADAMSEFREPKGRGEVVEIFATGGHATLIDDSYNASPASMKAAFEKAGALKKQNPHHKRLIAVLGDMRELGVQAQALHEQLAEPLIQNGFDKVFSAGELMHALQEKLPAQLRGADVANAQALLVEVQKALLPGDLVLVKGSHGSKTYLVAEGLKETDQTRKYHAL